MNQSQYFLDVQNNVRLFNQIWEPDGSAKAVVLLVHGWGEHSQRYQHVGQAFADAGFVLAATDLRGHGRTEGPRGFINSYNHEIFPDIDSLLKDLAEKYPNLPQFLYGHSTGGGIVLGYAIKKKPKVAGIIATSPWLTLKEPPSKMMLNSMKLMKRVYPKFRSDLGFTENLLSRDPAVDEAAKADELMHSVMTAGLFMEAVNNGRFVLHHAAGFPLPLLVMHGTGDKLTSYSSSQRFARQAPSNTSTFKAWQNAYHELHNDIMKEDAIGFMVKWLDGEVA